MIYLSRGVGLRTGGVLASVNQVGLDDLSSTNKHIPDFDLARQHPTGYVGSVAIDIVLGIERQCKNV